MKILKTKSYRIISLCLALLLLCTSSAMGATPISDDTEASDYISYTSVAASRTGNTVRIDFEIQGTGSMIKIGTTYIYLYSVDANGYESLVKTYYYLSGESYASQMMGYFTGYHDGYVTYAGSSGYTYYAQVVFLANNSSGGDSRIRTTDEV